MSGRVAEVGSAVSGWSVGDPVTVMPLRWCGACPACRAGWSHVCSRLDFVGIDSPGAMQEQWTVPAGLLVRLPPDVPLRRAALVEPTAVAVHDVRRAAVRPGESVVVVGGGPIGLLVACVARTDGARVLLVEVDENRRDLAQRLGFEVLDPAADPVAEHVEGWTDGAGADVAFEVSGAQGGLDGALASLGVRGRLVVVAIHPEKRSVDLFRTFWRELTVLGARVYQRPDFERAVELVASQSVPVGELISRVVPLESAGTAFGSLESGRRPGPRRRRSSTSPAGWPSSPVPAAASGPRWRSRSPRPGRTSSASRRTWRPTAATSGAPSRAPDDRSPATGSTWRTGTRWHGSPRPFAPQSVRWTSW
jgi:threonine dehydrogenase-like Zn-dependent dehydrogenase